MLLQVGGVSLRFGGLQAVADLSLTLPKGTITALIGPNGSGKTTLFNIVSGVYRPDSGRVVFEGTDVTGWSPHRLAQVGLVRTFQIARPLPNLTVLKTVTTGALCRHRQVSVARQRAMECLEEVGLTPWIHFAGRDLTVVQRKRLELARALAVGPRLLLLDEVAAGLNATELDEFSRLLARLRAKGITILVIEHNLRAIMSVAENVVVLHHGRKIGEAPPAEIVRDPKVIETYLGEGHRSA